MCDEETKFVLEVVSFKEGTVDGTIDSSTNALS